MSDADQIQMSYASETTFGEAAASGYQALRLTSESLSQDSQYQDSQELRADRQVEDTRRIGIGVSGDLNFELTYATFDDLIAAALMNDWATDAVENGTTLKSFTFERKYSDLSGEFAQYLGCAISQMSLSVQNQQLITGSFQVMGLEEKSAATAAGSPSAANTNPVMSAAEHVDGLEVGGDDIEFLQWTMQLQNNLRERPRVASLKSGKFGAGKLNLTGTLQMYFATKDIMDNYLNATTQGLTLDILDADGNSYAVSVPRFRFTNGSRAAGGENSDIIADMEWRAMRDPSSGRTVQITRTAAA